MTAREWLASRTELQFIDGATMLVVSGIAWFFALLGLIFAAIIWDARAASVAGVCMFVAALLTFSAYLLAIEDKGDRNGDN